MIVLLLQTMAMAEDAAGGDFGWWAMWDHSGYIAKSVIICLMLMLLWSLIVGVERMLAFRKARAQSMELAAKIVSKLQARDIAGALALTKSEDYAASYLAGMLRAGLTELNDRVDSYGVTNAARAIEKAHMEEISKMKKGMTVLATTGSTAPFVGLFGTTFGVINAFQGMAEAGSGLASISAGISEALVTTGVGIGVAVFGVWLFNYFTARAGKVKDELAASEADFNDWAEKLLQEPAAAAGK